MDREYWTDSPLFGCVPQSSCGRCVHAQQTAVASYTHPEVQPCPRMIQAREACPTPNMLMPRTGAICTSRSRSGPVPSILSLLG